MKIFLSSTCYDLEDLRAELEEYLISRRHKPLLSDRVNFPIDPRLHRHDICLDVVSECDLFILIIDSRFGAEYYKDSTISITWAEYRQAVKEKKEIIVFIRESIFNERQTYKKNQKNMDFKPFFVDNIKTYEFINEIQKESRGFWIQPFKNTLDIKKLLSGYLKSKEKIKIYEQKNQNAIKVQQFISKNKTIPLTAFSESAKEFILTSGNNDKEFTAESLSSIISLLPENGRAIGTLIDYEIDKYGMQNYSQAITIRPMDDDGSSWLCAEVLTPLGMSVFEELRKAKSRIE